MDCTASFEPFSKMLASNDAAAYLPLPTGDSRDPQSSPRARCRLLPPALVLVGVASFFLVSLLSTSNRVSPKACLHPNVRREWRTLNQEEKMSYIRAAQCLTKTPSTALRHQNASIHDEFALLHGTIGNYCMSESLFILVREVE